ncbi:MAG: hypothetical protein ACE5JB_00435 [bacterium]
MILKDSNKPTIILSYFFRILKSNKFIIRVAIICFYSGVVFFFGALAHRSRLISEGMINHILGTRIINEALKPLREGIKPILLGGFKVPFNYVNSFSANPEHIIIDINHKNFQKLAYKREMALRKGYLEFDDEDDNYVSAYIRYTDKNMRAKVRLKGNILIGIKGDKWPLRIIVKGDNRLFGMKKFSIQSPRERGFLNEWFFHKFLKYNNLPCLLYDFIDVTINGKHLGIYAIEEHFKDELFPNNNLREGIIIRFDESWTYYKYFVPTTITEINLQAYTSSTLSAHNLDLVETDSTKFKQFVVAKNLLESFRRKKLKTSQVFDIKKMAKFFAIVDLMGRQHHAIAKRNMKFYYNPVTSLLEPIGYDQRFLLPAKYLIGSSKQISKFPSIKDDIPIWEDTFFEDKFFYIEYIKALEKISDKKLLDSFFEKYKNEYKRTLNIIHKDYPWYNFDIDILYKNQETIRKNLIPKKAINVYYKDYRQDTLKLQISNIHYFPIKINSLSYNDSVIVYPTKEYIVQSKVINQPMKFQNIDFVLPINSTRKDSIIFDFKINYMVLGTEKILQESILPVTYLDENFIQNDFIRQESNIKEINFLVVNDSLKKIMIKPGEWNLDQNLLIPNGYDVFCFKDTKINLINSAKILSYSPIYFSGSADHPIIFYSADSSGQGLVVMNSNKTSSLQCVLFDNLSNPSQSDWALTGAVTFYESSVNITLCKFMNNRSEDALNIIRSEFQINNTLFRNTQSDAFDADFCKGEINNSMFLNCGNDGIDVSGTNIDIENITIDGAQDKGISAGEFSVIHAQNVEIRNTALALTSKDNSEFVIDGGNLKNCEIGYTVFQKKPEFGPGAITAKAVSIDKTNIHYLVEERSILLVDGKRIESNRKNVKEILYGVEYGKSSQ